MLEKKKQLRCFYAFKNAQLCSKNCEQNGQKPTTGGYEIAQNTVNKCGSFVLQPSASSCSVHGRDSLASVWAKLWYRVSHAHFCDTIQSALKHLDHEGRNQISVWSVVHFKMKNVRTVSVYSTEHNTCDQSQRQKLYVALCCSSVPSARNINDETCN